jgi:hypothetical protein
LISAENGEWFEALPGGLVKAWRIRIAQLILVVGFPAAIAAFFWASAPGSRAQNRTVRTSERPNAEKYAHWVQYLGLVAAFVLPTFLVQEPLGAGSLAILIWQRFCA